MQSALERLHIAHYVTVGATKYLVYEMIIPLRLKVL